MSNFIVSHEEKDGVVVIRTEGYLDDNGGNLLSEKCNALIDSGRTRFVFSLGQTPVINGTGLSMMLDLVVRIIDYNDGKVALTGLTKLTRTALQITGVLTLCQFFPTEEEAMENVSG